MDEMPEGSMVTHQLTVTSFLLPDGQEGFSVEAEGETNVGTSVGLLELAKFRLLSYQYEDEDDE
jgi:hypothetical protein